MDKLINEFSVGLFFWQLLIFIILIYLLKKFAWKPILNAVNERENSIAEALSSAEKAREEMAALKSDNERIVNEAKLEREALLKDGKKTGDAIVKKSKEIATEEAQKIIVNAKKSIENEKKMAIKDLKKQIAEISVEMAEKILKKQLSNGQIQENYLNELLDEVKLS